MLSHAQENFEFNYMYLNMNIVTYDEPCTGKYYYYYLCCPIQRTILNLITYI